MMSPDPPRAQSPEAETDAAGAAAVPGHPVRALPWKAPVRTTLPVWDFSYMSFRCLGGRREGAGHWGSVVELKA